MSVRSPKPSTGRQACASKGLSLKGVELLCRVEPEDRAAAGQRLEFLGTTVGDQSGSLHETDTGRHLGRKGPQDRAGVVGGQLDHPDSLTMPAAGDAGLVRGS